jgi:hypothetical protein
MDLVKNLQLLENNILYHVKLNQIETVESFLKVIINKLKLHDIIRLSATWNNITNKVYIIVSPVLNTTVLNTTVLNTTVLNSPIDEIYKKLIDAKFKHLDFIKYIECMPDEINDFKANIDNLILDSNIFSFDVELVNNKLKMLIVINEVEEKILKLIDEQYWLPDKRVFYFLDLLIGEYIMNNYIDQINFSSMIMISAKLLNINEIKIKIYNLLNIKICTICNLPEYRKKLCTN